MQSLSAKNDFDTNHLKNLTSLFQEKRIIGILAERDFIGGVVSHCRRSSPITQKMQKKIKTIGITGGICSGKSTIMNHLRECIAEHERLQQNQQQDSSEVDHISNAVPLIHFHIISTDELGWKAYEVDTPCYHKVIEEFGPLVKEKLGEDPSVLVDAQTRQINRRVLGE